MTKEGIRGSKNLKIGMKSLMNDLYHKFIRPHQQEDRRSAVNVNEFIADWKTAQNVSWEHRGFQLK